VKVLVNVVNVALSTSLVLGLGWFPKLGWEGLAVGTACGHGLAGLLILLVLVHGRRGAKLKWADMRPDRPMIRRLLYVGVPGGVDVLAVITCHLVYVSIINRLGSVATAAHGMAVQIEALAYLPGSAFQVSAATMVGQLLGAGLPNRAMRSALVALALGGTFMCLAGTVLFFGGSHIAAFFTGQPDDPSTRLAGELLPIVSLGMPWFAVMAVLAGALRGAGDTRWPLVVTFVGLLCIRIPGAAWLAHEHLPLEWLHLTLPGWNLGVKGAWYAMLADVAVRSTLIGGRFLSGRWQQTRV
jgi:putative MATE family efflux protein